MHPGASLQAAARRGQSFSKKVFYGRALRRYGSASATVALQGHGAARAQRHLGPPGARRTRKATAL